MYALCVQIRCSLCFSNYWPRIINHVHEYIRMFVAVYARCLYSKMAISIFEQHIWDIKYAYLCTGILFELPWWSTNSDWWTHQLIYHVVDSNLLNTILKSPELGIGYVCRKQIAINLVVFPQFPLTLFIYHLFWTERHWHRVHLSIAC